MRVFLRVASFATIVVCAFAFMPQPSRPSRLPTCMHAVNIPDGLKQGMSKDQIKTLQNEAERSMQAAAADLDPWFVEAEADANSVAAFAMLEAIATPPSNETEAAVAEGEGEGEAQADGTTPLPSKPEIPADENRRDL